LHRLVAIYREVFFATKKGRPLGVEQRVGVGLLLELEVLHEMSSGWFHTNQLGSGAKIGSGRLGLEVVQHDALLGEDHLLLREAPDRNVFSARRSTPRWRRAPRIDGVGRLTMLPFCVTEPHVSALREGAARSSAKG
jgi:hypothetical protein